MVDKLERDVRFLKIYAAIATLVCTALLLSAFTFQQPTRQKFEEIDVERINIVEKDGKLRMVISNRERQHPGVVDGKIMPRSNGRPAGMLVRRRDDHDPSPLRKAPLTATVGAAMLLISLYVRRILTASREPASQAASGAR